MNIRKIIRKIVPEQLLIKRREYIAKKHDLFYIKKQRRNELILKKLKRKRKKQDKIRVGFYVIYDSSWGNRPLYELLKKDSSFDTKIVVCPDVTRGEVHQQNTLNTVYEELTKLYGEENVLLSLDLENNHFIDYSNMFDIVSVSSPYDKITHEYYSTHYLQSRGKLVIFSSYGYQGKLKFDIELMKMDTYNLFWKLFVDNTATQQLGIKYQNVHGLNIVVSGSCKMDKFVNSKINNNYDKTIMICPHHTVRKWEGGLNLSNFLRFSEVILNLPKKYPNIKFIFRPHPLLFTALRADDLWGNEKVDNYIKQICSNKNVFYSTKGLYFDDFNESDAMIDDCGSFLAEYFYTGKPQCYVLQSETQFENEYIDFGKEFFNHVYKAISENDMYNFIENVVLDGNDYLKERRLKFAEEKVCINYPNVSSFILNYLKKELGVL